MQPLIMEHHLHNPGHLFCLSLALNTSGLAGRGAEELSDVFSFVKSLYHMQSPLRMPPKELLQGRARQTHHKETDTWKSKNTPTLVYTRTNTCSNTDFPPIQTHSHRCTCIKALNIKKPNPVKLPVLSSNPSIVNVIMRRECLENSFVINIYTLCFWVVICEV